MDVGDAGYEGGVAHELGDEGEVEVLGVDGVDGDGYAEADRNEDLGGAVVVHGVAAWVAERKGGDLCPFAIQHQVFVSLTPPLRLRPRIRHTHQPQQRYLTNTINLTILGPMETILHLLITYLPEMRVIRTGRNPLLKQFEIVYLLPTMLKYFLLSCEPITRLPKRHPNILYDTSDSFLFFRICER